MTPLPQMKHEHSILTPQIPVKISRQNIPCVHHTSSDISHRGTGSHPPRSRGLQTLTMPLPVVVINRYSVERFVI